MLLTGKANAASWKGPTMEPLVIQPKSPWKKEPSGLSFENLTATAASPARRVGDVAMGQEACPGSICLGSVHCCQRGQHTDKELLMQGCLSARASWLKPRQAYALPSLSTGLLLRGAPVSQPCCKGFTAELLAPACAFAWLLRLHPTSICPPLHWAHCA